MCKDKATWDDPFEPKLEQEWKAWKHELDQLKNLKVEICIFPNHLGPLKKTELHHFSDASSKGIGQCSYLRLIDVNDTVRCTLLCSKSRVALIKPTTKPRSELQAAVLSAKISRFLKSELNMLISKEYFWTDSKSNSRLSSKPWAKILNACGQPRATDLGK